MAKVFSTSEVAKAAGVSSRTLYRWLVEGRVPEPKWHKFGGLEVRAWTEKDVERVKSVKEETYRKRT